MNSGKSLPITKLMVWEAYKLVRRKGKAAGVDGQSLDEFAEDLENNLYRLWNRMASGSYLLDRPAAAREQVVGGDQCRYALVASGRPAISTVTAASLRPSSHRNCRSTMKRMAMAFGVRDVKTKPSPASAFRQMIGSPSAATEPIMVGASAT
jgi:hypothetical protein